MSAPFTKHPIIYNSGSAQVNGAVLYAGRCVVYRIHIAHANGTAAYYQIHDASSTPSEGAAGLACGILEGNTDHHVDFDGGAVFENGVYVCESDTLTTKTLAAASHIAAYATILPYPDAT